MIHSLRRNLSYARLTSGLAIAIAVASGAQAAVLVPANSVGAKQLRKGAVTSPKLGADAVTQRAVKSHSLNASALASGELEAGPPGPAGAAGAAGPPQFARLDYRTSTYVVHPNYVAAISAVCDTPGARVIGGGAQVTGLDTGEVAILDSFPDGRMAWRGQAGNVSPTDQTLTTYAVCAATSGTTP